MKILNTLLTLGCLSGLVSCYPVVGQNQPIHNQINKKTVSVKTPSTDKVNDVNNTMGTTLGDVSDSASDVSDTAYDTVEKNLPPKPPVPKGVKTASKVPGKEGFVFNPYTHNQVDVRGIPSGTKVRDPHDSNPAHVFRVP